MNADGRVLELARFDLLDYETAWRAMQSYTDTRDAGSPDRIWLLQHPSVFTLGQAGRSEHLLDPGTIPVIKVDRGGQVTWHGPGQCVAYLMLDLRRLGLGVRELVDRIESAIIATLAVFGIAASARRDAPGVYVNGAKIAALGLRIRRGCSFHGLSLNVDPDLSAFARINPCGHAGLAVTSMAQLVVPGTDISRRCVESVLSGELLRQFGYAPQAVRHIDDASP
jgi:lipoyl(octanoyl) transferase